MADLTVLIRLHKYTLDEKRRVLSDLYGSLALLERERQELEQAFEREKEAAENNGDNDMHFAFVRYTDTVNKKRADIEQRERQVEQTIENAKQSMMETFAELKKYEMTQEERDRLEEEERRIRENRMMDEIGIEGFRRRES